MAQPRQGLNSALPRSYAPGTLQRGHSLLRVLGGSQDKTRRVPISAGEAPRCWTAAMQGDFRERNFQATR